MAIVEIKSRVFNVQVDDADLELIGRYEWFLDRWGYPVTQARVRGRWALVPMHRIIMDTPPGYHTDHIDGDILNNTRTNLRVCTNQENQRNSRKHAVGTSQFKGVSWNKKIQAWSARITPGNRTPVWIGSFENELHAALAYDFWATYLFGKYARTNFPTVSHSGSLAA